MSNPKNTGPPTRRGLWVAGTALTALTALTAIATAVFSLRTTTAEASPTAPAAAIAVSVATVVKGDVAIWDEFSGRLEAVERVDIRSRVAGTVQAVHFREGALVKRGDPLMTIDPAPYAAEVDRAQAQVAAAEARLSYTRSEYDRRPAPARRTRHRAARGRLAHQRAP